VKLPASATDHACSSHQAITIVVALSATRTDHVFEPDEPYPLEKEVDRMGLKRTASSGNCSIQAEPCARI
jgi:hypothetical protein